MNRFVFFFALLPVVLLTEIREATRMAEIFSEVRLHSIVLMDIDETLIESSIMLGGKAWRDYAAHLLKTAYSSQKVQDLRDKITYWIAKHVPCVAVETVIPIFLDQLKEKQIPVFGFTARGKQHWNTMPCEDGEEIACLHLKQAGCDLHVFSQSRSDAFLSHPSFGKGVFFAKHPFADKGSLALEVFAVTPPAHVLFVDDRLDNVHSMNLAFEQLNIPALCFHYPHIDLYRSFDPLIAAIQLEKLYVDNLLLSDHEAALLKADYAHRDPDLLLLEVLSHFDCSSSAVDQNPIKEFKGL